MRRELGTCSIFMEKYGTAQEIVSNSSENKDEMGRWLLYHFMCRLGLKIVHCYDKRAQKNTRTKTRSNETYDEINEQHEAGYTVTGICYSTGLRQYFVVFTKIPEVQCIHYFDGRTAVLNWMDEQHHVGYHPNIIHLH